MATLKEIYKVLINEKWWRYLGEENEKLKANITIKV